jgi:hypothetical protein
MNTDLERELRTALRARADAVTSADLRHATGAAKPVRRTSRTVGRLVAPLAAAACVAVLAAVIATRGGTGARSAGGGHSAAVLVGQDWQLSTIRRAGGESVTVPAGLAAGIAFESAKVLSFGWGSSDRFPAYRLTRCTYTSVAGGIAVGTESTDRGGTVRGRSARLTDAAIDAATRPGTRVAIDHGPRALVLTAGGYVFTFADEVPLATSSPPSPGRGR